MSWVKWVGGGIGALIAGPAGAAIGAGLGSLIDEEIEESESLSSQQTSYSFSFTSLNFEHQSITSYGPSLKVSISIEENKYTFADYLLIIRPLINGSYVTSSSVDFADKDGDIFNVIKLEAEVGPYTLFLPYSAFLHSSSCDKIDLECVLVKDNTVHAKTVYTLTWGGQPQKSSNHILMACLRASQYIGSSLGISLSDQGYQDRVIHSLAEFFSLNEEGINTLHRMLPSVGYPNVTSLFADLEREDINIEFCFRNLWSKPFHSLQVPPHDQALFKAAVDQIFHQACLEIPQDIYINLFTQLSFIPELRLDNHGSSLSVLMSASGDIPPEMLFCVRILTEEGELAKAPEGTDKDYVDGEGYLMTLTNATPAENSAYGLISFPLSILPSSFCVRGFVWRDEVKALIDDERIFERASGTWEIDCLCQLTLQMYQDEQGLTAERVQKIRKVLKEDFGLTNSGLQELRQSLKKAKKHPISFKECIDILKAHYDQDDAQTLLESLCNIALYSGEYPSVAYELLKSIARTLNVPFSIIDQVRSQANSSTQKTNNALQEAYKILELSMEAEFNEVKQAYRRLSKDYHPDLNSALPAHIARLAEEQFKKIQGAYELLKSHHS